MCQVFEVVLRDTRRPLSLSYVATSGAVSAGTVLCGLRQALRLIDSRRVRDGRLIRLVYGLHRSQNLIGRGEIVHDLTLFGRSQYPRTVTDRLDEILPFRD